MRRKTFRKAYLIFCAVLVVAVLCCLAWLFSVLRNYEKSQPETLLASVVEQLRVATESNTVSKMLTVPAELDSSFRQGTAIYSEYVDLLNHADMTYARKAGGSEGDYTDYIIKADEKPLVTVRLHAVSQTQKLGFLTVVQYETVSVTPVITCYEVTLPKAFYLSVDGNTQDGTPAEDAESITYHVVLLSEHEVAVSDRYGHRVIYGSGVELTTQTYTVTVPDNYTVKVGSKQLSASEDAELSDNPSYEYVREYNPSLPRLATYKIDVIGTEPDIIITDNLGAPVEASLQNNQFSIDHQAGADALPADIANAVDPLAIGQKWSLFMTNDLGPARESRGYYKIKEHLINDSYLDNKAWEWATHIDITFVSIHTLCNPTFLEESVSNYIRYSDTFFSCDVSFIKHMILETGLDIRDRMNSTFYFTYTDDPSDGTGNPRWYLIDIREILDKED